MSKGSTQITPHHWEPTVKNFKHIIKSNQIQNCPITMEDIEIAEQIHGKDMSHLKGKQQDTTQQQQQLQ